ncbi:MAG: hypothetical protein AB1571_03750 [Nanoarchaeota archaeon]
MAELILLPIIPLAIIIGLYELIAIHSDMSFRGSHWLGHGLGAIISIAIALFITMNTEYFIEAVGITYPYLSNPLILRIVVGLILNFKIHAQSSLARGGGGIAARGLAEHWMHTIIVSVLVIIAPYIWPLVEPIVPTWLGGAA